MLKKRILQIVILLFVAIFVTTGCNKNSTPDTEPSNQTADTPPALTGEELVNGRCIECHTMDRIKRDRSNEEWDEHTHRMLSKSPEMFTEEEFLRVLEYLQEQY
ncbi:MAG: hypothetical protein GX357_06965 [Firmicutes bacterium]|nr:hypothetical protein [Bacillota bacterium]